MCERNSSLSGRFVIIQKSLDHDQLFACRVPYPKHPDRLEFSEIEVVYADMSKDNIIYNILHIFQFCFISISHHVHTNWSQSWSLLPAAVPTVVRCSEFRHTDNFIHHCTFNLYSNLGNGGRPRKSWGTISGALPPASVWSTWRCKKARDFTSDNTCLNHVHQFFQRNLTLYIQYINLVHLIHERAIPKYCLYLL